MKLYLVQHGEACSKELDPDRPLTAQGVDDIDRMAAFIKQANVRVERVIHSGKLRAQQTAERLAAAMAPGVKPEISSLISPNDDPGTFVRQIENREGDALVVGHLPFMAKLVSHLLDVEKAGFVTAYQPGSMVCLERVEGTHWQIDWMIRPELLN